VYETYGAEYDVLKKGEPYRWGTYANRLLRRRTATGETVNPLRSLIAKMKNEHQQEHRGTYRACYELGIAEGEYDIPLYNTVVDQGRRRGGPCLSPLQSSRQPRRLGAAPSVCCTRSWSFDRRPRGPLDVCFSRSREGQGAPQETHE